MKFARVIVITILISIAIIPAISNKAYAYSINNSTRCSFQNLVTSCALIIPVTSSGDLIAIGISASNGVNGGFNTLSVTGISDNQTNTWTKAKELGLSFGANCLAGNCFDDAIWYTSAHNSGHLSITASFNIGTANNNGNMEGIDASGIPIGVISNTGSSSCTSPCGFSLTTSPVSLPFNSVSALPFSSVFTSCQASGGGLGLNAGSGYIATLPTSIYEGGIMYANTNSPPNSPTNFLWTCTAISGGNPVQFSNAIDIGVIFGVSNGGGGNFVSGNDCDIICAVVNQATLYTATIATPLAVIILITRIFSAMNFRRIGTLTGLSLSMIGLSFWGLIPWFITVLVTGISIYTLLSGRKSQP